jgi:hypothetical protein
MIDNTPGYKTGLSKFESFQVMQSEIIFEKQEYL